MKARLLTVLLLGFIATTLGCASLNSCNGDWYERGWSDGLYGASPRAGRYAERCPGVNAREYNRGWRDGDAARPLVGWM